jgi:hypothetical protein
MDREERQCKNLLIHEILVCDVVSLPVAAGIGYFISVSGSVSCSDKLVRNVG